MRSHRHPFRLGKVNQNHHKNSKRNHAGSHLFQLSTMSWSQSGCMSADSRIVTMENFIKIKIQNNNYRNTKSISPLSIHYTCGALRYLMKALPLPERFPTWNKVCINGIHKMQCKYQGVSSADIAFANSRNFIKFMTAFQLPVISEWLGGYLLLSFIALTYFAKAYFPKSWTSTQIIDIWALTLN